MQRSTWTLYPLWSETRHLFDTWEKNKRAWFRHFFTRHARDWISFRQELICSSVWRLRDHHFFPVVKERPGIRHQCCWLQINIFHVELVLWTDIWLSASNKPPAHQLCEVIRALHIWGGLHRPTFCIQRADNRYLDRNSTKMKTISIPRYSTGSRQEFDKNENNQYTQVFDEFMANNLSGFARKSTVKKYLAPHDSPSNLRRPLTRGGQSSRWPLH
jgi:hypothetical protein